MDAFQTLLVASLLHDLGKLWQRTGEHHSERYARYGPETYGQHGAHAKWSADAVERHVPAWQTAAQPILQHHRPRERIGRLVALADRLSAAERDDTETERPAALPGGGALWAAARFGQRQLRSVFCRIRLDHTTASPEDACWPLAPLAFRDDVLFPLPGPVDEETERTSYQRLWQELVQGLSRLPESLDFEARFVTVLHLLARTTWCVPSAYYQQATPDISLYDHLRTTCALAAALERSGLDDQTLDSLLARRVPEWETPRLALLAADVTGVQRFLYTLTAARAARSLRGRSFFLQLVTEAVGRWLLRQLDLPIVNLLYAGGGRCYLLAPLPSEEQLTALRRQLDRILLATTGGELYLALAARPLACADLTEAERFAAAWNDLHRALQDAKTRKFSALPASELTTGLFSPRGVGGPEPPCTVCRREGAADQLEEDLRVCHRCSSLVALGSELLRARWVFLREVPPVLPQSPAERAPYHVVLRALGSELRLVHDDADLGALASLGRGTLLRVDSTDFLTEPALAAAARSGCIALGFAPLANAVPLERDGTIMEFASIAASGTGATGLGILRMDVDDLGRIFASGLGEQLSLSRLASLSSGLRLFFEGWLTEKARQWNRQGKPVYLVYSGGDDVFAVGHWNTVARFAQEIRADFRRFTSQNPALHLSAGIAVVPEHAPLYQTADEAKDALEAAKQRREDGRLVKDAVTVFGRTLSWPAYGAVAARAAELATAVEEHGLPRSLLQALAAIGRLYEDAYREAQHRRTLRPGQLVYGRWMWLAAYTLARAVERLGTATPAARSLTTLRDELTRPEVIGTLWLVSRWAQLLTRKEEPS